mmetsp:Transcript_16367/g.40035  ORF Transcript_16367/g.40035 Transcript_16367/m.40035 type:complete len:307 (-) Transcript_16367:379-1299(-)
MTSTAHLASHVLKPTAARLFLGNQARHEAVLQLLAVEVAANEHHAVDALLVGAPFHSGWPEVDVLVHALEHKLGVALVLEAQHPLGAVDVQRVLLQHLHHEGVDHGKVQLPLGQDADAGHPREVVPLLARLLLRRLLRTMTVTVTVPVTVPVGLVLALLVGARRLGPLHRRLLHRLCLHVALLVVQEIGVHLQRLLDAERVHAQHAVQVHHAVAGLDHLRHGVDGLEGLHHHRQLLGGHQVDLVEQDAVRKRNLRHSLVDGAVGLLLLQVDSDVLGVRQAQDGVDAVDVGNLGVDEERERHGGGVR